MMLNQLKIPFYFKFLCFYDYRENHKEEKTKQLGQLRNWREKKRKKENVRKGKFQEQKGNKNNSEQQKVRG